MTTLLRPGTLILLAGGIVAGCGEPLPTGADRQAATPSPGLLSAATGFLECVPLTAETATAIVGPAGGRVEVGPHRLVVPAGALAEDVAITAAVESESARRIAFSPEGLTFAEPASLTLGYAGCGVGDLLLRIAYVTDDLVILDYLPSLTDPEAREVTALLDHFSNYAVAW